MKRIKTLLSIIFILLLLIGCSTNYVDMSNYKTYDSSINYRFVKSSVLNMEKMINDGKTFVIYFGFAKCPWCNDFINLISQETDRDIYYVDCRENSEWKSNLDIDNYDLLINLIGDKLNFDDNNIKHLYVPHTFFFKDGKLVYDIRLTGYNAKEEKLPEDIKLQIINQLKEAFNLLK